MSIYQRYLSKSLIFFSSLIFLIIFLLESNFGFKLFFNITNYFFLGLKTEEISGNWRDFKLKNTTFNSFGISIKATDIHVLIDPMFLFKSNKIFKQINTKNLIFSLNKNNLFSFKKNIIKTNILEKNIFFDYCIILKKIYSDKILIKLNNMNILLSNVHSGIKLINNHCIILRTYVNSIVVDINKNNSKYFLSKKTLINKNRINNFLSLFLEHKKILLPIHINLISIKCKKIKIFDQKFKNILFQGKINNKFIFKLKFNDFLKFNLYGRICLKNINHPIYIDLYIHRLTLPIKKKLVFISKNFHLILKGTVNNYNLLFKNIINISGMPPVSLNILGSGNLTNISLNKINFIPLFKQIKNNKFTYLRKENCSQYIPQISGRMNISNNFDKGINSINISSFNIKANILDKQLLMLGSLYYNQINNIKIPTIKIFSGKNKGFLSGSISKLININSSININDLDYFIPNLKGIVAATLNVYGFCSSPILSGIILGEKLNWNDIIYLNSIKMFINMNDGKNLKKRISLTIKKIKFLKFYLDFLNLKLYWNNFNQNFCLFLKNNNLIVNFIINGKFNYKKYIWQGTFKKIKILIFNKKWIINNHPNIFCFNNKNIQKNKKNQIKHKNYIFLSIDKIKKFLFSSIFDSSIHFKSNLFFQTQFISKNEKKNNNIKFFLYSNHIKLQKRIKNTILYKEISSLNLSINFKNNNLITHWIIYPLKNKNKKLFGFLNIYDVFHKQHIKGKYFLFDFPCSIVNFFLPQSTVVQGLCVGNIKIFGTLYQPHILADIHLKNFNIKSNKILKYIILFFYPSLNFIKYIKINQLIFIKKGDISFELYFTSKKNIFNSIEWNIFFNSNHMLFFIFPKIKLNFFSQLNLHYFLLKYDLIGYLKSSLFYFKIKEKNFIF